MMPSPFASAYVYGRANAAFTGRPTESRKVPVPIVTLGFPLGSLPNERILLLLCDAATVRSHPMSRRSTIVLLSSSSTPEFWTDARFFSTDSAGDPEDAAICWLISASCVFLLQ